jgi:NADPH2:quinone reductase
LLDQTSDEPLSTALQPRAIDVVFDGVGGAIARVAFELLRPGGRFVTYAMASGTFADITQAEAHAHGVQLIRGIRATPAELRTCANAALMEAVQGRWRPLIGQTFSLEHAADAHAAMQERTTIGKTLLLLR